MGVQCGTLLVILLSLEIMLVVFPVAMASRGPHRLVCKILPTDVCAFAVDSLGQRCILETVSDREDWHVCQTSNVIVGEESPMEYIETDQCVKACGVTKMTVGLPTDILRSRELINGLCSSDCTKNCPNLIDLFSKFIAEEGSTLAKVCTEHNRRRIDVESISTTTNLAATRIYG